MRTLLYGAGVVLCALAGAAQRQETKPLVLFETPSWEEELLVLGRSPYFRAVRGLGRPPALAVGERLAPAPLEEAARALAHVFELPYGERTLAGLARLLGSVRGPLRAALFPAGPCLMVAVADAEPVPPPGLYSLREGSLWLLAPRPALLARGRALWRRLGPPRQPRLLLALAGLRRHRPAAGGPLATVLAHWAGLPAEVSWRRTGRIESVTVRSAGLAGLLAREGGAPAWPPLRSAVRWTGRVRLEPARWRAALAGNPGRLLASLLRAWPLPPPETEFLLRHWTGRFQVVFRPGTLRSVPLVGLELRHPRRSAQALMDRLVGSGVCRAVPRGDEGMDVVLFSLRLPGWLLDGQLQWFIRRYSRHVRVYRVGLTGRWVWCGPEQDVLWVLDRAAAEEPFPAPEGGGRLVLEGEGAAQILRAELQEFPGVHRQPELLRYVDCVAETLARAGRLDFRVRPAAGGVRVERAVRPEYGLWPLWVLAGARLDRLLRDEETAVRTMARRSLRGWLRAQKTYHRRHGRYARSLSALAGTVVPTPEYRFGVVLPAGEGFWLYAWPRRQGLTGFRPAYALGPDGRLLAGPAASPPGPGWRPPEDWAPLPAF